MEKDNGTFTTLSLEEGHAYAARIGLPFLTAAWEEILTDAFPYLSFSYVLYKKEFLVRFGVVDGRFTAVPFSDGGDVFALADTLLSLPKLKDDLLEHFGSVPSVRVHTFFCPIEKNGDFVADLIDFRVTLSDFDEHSLRKTLRHIITRNQSDGVSVRFGTEKDLRVAFALYLTTMRRVRAFALPFSAFARIARNGLFVSEQKGKIVGASLFVEDGKTAHYFLSMVARAGKEAHVAHHLLFQALLHCKASGKEAVFLGGTRIGSSLEIFKEGWRGTPYLLYTLSSTRESTRTSPLRSLWRLLPLPLLPFVSRLLGKYLL